VVCLSALAPDGTIQVRYLLKRIRAQFEELEIVVGRWGYSGEKDKLASGLKARGANTIVTNLASAVESLRSSTTTITLDRRSA
jgi:hypothetical protein